MSVQATIESKLTTAFTPEHLELVNESHQHAGGPGRETHFNLILVSSAFEGQSRVQRQRAVYRALGDELKAGLHALTMKTLTPSELAAEGGSVDNTSPACHGGSKHSAG